MSSAVLPNDLTEAELAAEYPRLRRGLNYWEVWDSVVTHAEARAEIARHDIGETFDDFVREVGDRQIYFGHEVIEWLGY